MAWNFRYQNSEMAWRAVRTSAASTRSTRTARDRIREHQAIEILARDETEFRTILGVRGQGVGLVSDQSWQGLAETPEKV